MKPGSRVVCINDDFPEGLQNNIKLPKAGRVYTVRTIQPSPFGDEYLGITLEGLENRSEWFGRKNGYVLSELCFASFRFRAVNSKEANDWGERSVRLLETSVN